MNDQYTKDISLDMWAGSAGHKRYSIFKKICSNKSVLDLGCAYGLSSYFIADVASQVDGVDCFDDHIECAKKKYKKDNLTYYKFDFNDESLDKKFDVIIASEVIEHFKTNIEESLIKMNSLLKNEGKICLTFPLNEKKSVGSHLHSGITLESVSDTGAKIGFKILESFEYWGRGTSGLLILQRG